jgi:hypothetical protein
MDSRALAMTSPTIGLGVLSWRGAKSLDATLKSYHDTNLFSLFDEVVVFLPDPDDDVQKVAKKYSVTFRTAQTNLGILENIAATAACLSTEFFLFVENDCPIIETREEAQKQIDRSLKLLEREDVIMSRLRSIRHPGEDFDGLRKYRTLYKSGPLAQFRRIFRPGKVKRLSGYARYDGPDAMTRHEKYIEDLGDDYYLMDCAIMPWTNQSILMRRKRFLETIIPHARQVKTSRGANKLPNLEIEMNKGDFWRKSGWKILCGPGLFTHRRAEFRGY